MLDFIQKYIDQRFKVYFAKPYIGDGRKSDGKIPLHANGVNGAISDLVEAKKMIAQHPDANIGIKVELPFFIIDIDMHHGNGFQEWESIAETVPETLTSTTGAGGRHIWFRFPEKILHEIQKGTIKLSGKFSDNIDLKHNGGVIVAPSKTVNEYSWDSEGDYPDFKTEVAIAPEWILKRIITAASVTPETQTNQPIVSINELDRLQEAMKYIHDADTRETWLQVGMSLHATGQKKAFDIWDDWSSQSAKYDRIDQVRVWLSFSRRANGFNPESVYFLATQGGWSGEVPEKQTGFTIDLDAIRKNGEARVPKIDEEAPFPPVHLLQVPIRPIQAVVEYIESITEKSHPQIAVQGALALFSTVFGRHYRTDLRNRSSLFFTILGKTTIGKNAPKQAIRQILYSHDKLRRFDGGSGYSSPAAIYSTLLEKPVHLSIIDEFGKILTSANNRNQSHLRMALDKFLELYSDVDGFYAHHNRSTHGLTDSQKKSMKSPVIVNPAITLLTLSTPSQFFEGINHQTIHDGFLNRLIIVNADERLVQRNQTVNIAPPGEEVMNAILALGGRMCAPTVAPKITDVLVSSDAKGAFSAFGNKIERRIAELEEVGLDDLLGRWRENAMRLSLILSVADAYQTGKAANPSIELAHAAWAIDYVEHYGEVFVKTIQESLGHTRFDELKLEFLKAFRKRGSIGFSKKQMASLPPFRYVSARERMEIISDLLTAQEIETQVARQKTKTGGRPSQNYRVSGYKKPLPQLM